MNVNELKKAAKILKAMTENRMLSYQPYAKQREFHDAGATHRERVLLAANQPQPLNAEIQTPQGPTQMGMLSVGDRVLAGDGTATRVNAILPQGVLDVYRMVFDDGTTVDCALSHKWPVVRPAHRWPTRNSHGTNETNKNYRKVSSVSLEEIIATGGLSPKPIQRFAFPACEPVVYDGGGALPIHPYLMGILLGDGCFRNGSVSLTNGADAIIERVLSLLPVGQTVTQTLHKGLHRLHFTGGKQSPVNRSLEKFGLMGRGSHEKHIPDVYLLGSVEQRIELLHGLNDTDGSMTKDGLTCEYGTSSPRLAVAYTTLVESLGGIVKVKQRQPWYTYKGERRLGRVAFRLMIRNIGFNPFRFERKACRWHERSRARDRILRNIEFVGRAEMRCITVDHPDHTYLTDHFISTLNSGKTHAAAMEVAFHCTGRYPEWWQGRRFKSPVRCWVAGTSAEGTRDTVQRLLMGDPPYGTGSLPKSAIKEVKQARSVTSAVGQVYIHHVSGGTSYFGVRTYEQPRERWQGESLNLIWYDEEPPLDLYTEGLTRLNARQGIALMTMTPLLGMSKVVRFFYPYPTTLDRHMTSMTIDDVDHYTENEREQISASYMPHEREARLRGIPMLGSGRVFPIQEEKIACKPFEIPDHWPRLGGVDFGWDHPTGCVAIAWDRDADCIYVTHAYREAERTPSQITVELRHWSENMPWTWPHDGHVHDKGSGVTIADQYRREGLRMMREHATFDRGGHGLEAGIMEMLQRMQSGRLKVFRHLEEWFSEFQMYHRKDGRIVKENDDLLSATRLCVMAKRFARTQEPLHTFPTSVGVDYDPFAPRAA